MLKNLNCDKTQKLKLWPNLETQLMTKLKKKHALGFTVENYLAASYLGGFMPAPCSYVDIIVVWHCTALLQQ